MSVLKSSPKMPTINNQINCYLIKFLINVNVKIFILPSDQKDNITILSVTVTLNPVNCCCIHQTVIFTVLLPHGELLPCWPVKLCMHPKA